MSRAQKKQLERQLPEMAHAVRMSKGEITADSVVKDRMDEEGIRPAGGDLMLQRFKVGQAYWLETSHWVYIGRVIAVGIDYLELDDVCRMLTDGRHSTMMATGTAPRMVTEASGGKLNRMMIPVDWIGPTCEWHFPIPGTFS